MNRQSPSLRSRRFLNVVAVVESLRERHPELSVPLRVSHLERILAREQIGVVRLPIASRAYTLGNDGVFVIVVNSSLSARLYSRVVAHEYAHIKLHRTERGEVSKELSGCQRGDPREFEAELFVLLLRLGPTATPEHPDVARLIAKLEAAERHRRAPTQLPLAIAERPRRPLTSEPLTPSTPRPRELVGPEDERFLGEMYWLYRPTRRGTIPEALPPRDELARITFDPARRATRFTDRFGQPWWVYNYTIIEADGARQQVRVSDAMSPTITHRRFVNVLGDERLYRFKDARERRDHRVKHLDRQLLQSRPLPPRHPVGLARKDAFHAPSKK